MWKRHNNQSNHHSGNMQEIIHKCINELKHQSAILLKYEDANLILCDANNDNLIKNTASNFKAILIREDVYLEDYCAGISPLVYDLIEFSNKNLFLQLPKLKHASEHLKTDKEFATYHVPKDEFISQLCHRYRKALALLQIEKETKNSIYTVNLQTIKNPFTPRSIIRLKENGEIKVIEK